MGQEAFLNYLSFTQLLEARNAAKTADGRALWAQLTAVVAILVSVGLGWISYHSPPTTVAEITSAQIAQLESSFKTVRLDDAQMQQIIGALNPGRAHNPNGRIVSK